MDWKIREACCSTLSVVSFSKAEMYCDSFTSGTEEADESFPPIFDIFERSGSIFDARSRGRNSCSKRLYRSFTSWEAQEITPFDASSDRRAALEGNSLFSRLESSEKLTRLAIRRLRSFSFSVSK
uniref:Eif3 n=1 Tax=Arundo donax TaxID=35708 RepID=A0A0A9CWE9_ARUDO